MNKIHSLSLKKNNIELTDEEKNFIRYIYLSIYDSEDEVATISYLSSVLGISISSIKYLKNIYFTYLATKEEKIEFAMKKKQERNRGFVNISITLTITLLISVFGIVLAIILYNLL